MTREEIIRMAREAGFETLMPSEHIHGTGGVYVGDDDIAGMLERFAARVAAAALAEPVQEPVAKVELMMTGGNAGLATRIVEIDDHLRERLRPGQLLYTAPPQRKPLTDEELDALAIDEDGLPNSHIEFARAIERAHGIKE